MPKTTFAFNGAKLALDARPDRLDLRDRLYMPRMQSLPPEFPPSDSVRKYLPSYIAADLVLDQGSEGACTGFGLAALVNYLFWARDPLAKKAPPGVSPRMLYHLAQFYDEWPGEDYSGSSCRGALKGWHKHGVCTRHLWPYTVEKDGTALKFEPPIDDTWALDALTRPLGVYYRVDKNSVTDMQAAICEIGAVYVSSNVHDGWDLTNFKAKRGPFTDYSELPVIPYPSTGGGGHSFSLVGYTERGFVVQNSWGSGWGDRGFAILTYADWVAHGVDVWAASLGVPIDRGGVAKVVQKPTLKNKAASNVHPPASPAYRAGLSLLAGSSAVSSVSGVDFKDCLSSAGAYGQAIVMGNDGGLINRIVEVQNATASLERVVYTGALAWLKDRPKARVAIYAHGGLNAESDSIERIRVMAPYFLANEVYPIFITWKTGWAETIGDILGDKLHDFIPAAQGAGDWLNRVKEQITDATDRALEAVSEECGVKTQWTQMKQNALAAADGTVTPMRGMVALADQLKRLAKALDGLEIHLVGHSAGSLVHGNLLTLLAARKLEAKTCTLYAPACTIDFANRTYRLAIEGGVLARDDFHIHLMSDAREAEDNVGRVYRKSLLYLVARALETAHKTPLLGMASSFDGERLDEEFWNAASLPALLDWNTFYWGGLAPRGIAEHGKKLTAAQAATLHVEDRKQVSTGPRKIATAHGSFDNDVDAVGATIARIVGVDDPAQLKRRVVNLDY